MISFDKLTKYYGANLILDGISGFISKKSRIGIIGANGAGKSTLLKLICGEEEADSGTLSTEPGVKVGYLTQNFSYAPDSTVYETMQSHFKPEIEAVSRLEQLDLNTADGRYEYDRLLKFINARDAYNTDMKINYVLNGLGFDGDTKNQRVDTLSGGEKTRLSLAGLLLSDSDLLLLDEPTNHLDFKTCIWLEGYLETYSGAVISVTHDRYYLDKTCDEIWELEFGKLNTYKGNYSAYRDEKAASLAFAEKEYAKQTAQREKLEDYVARNIVRASTSKMAKSRQKELDKMEPLQKPREYRKQIHIKFMFDKKSWFDVLKCTELSVKIDDRTLFSGLSIDIKAGEKIAIIGDNGVGKTTFFKVLVGEHGEYSGKIRWGNDVSLGVYEQTHIYENPDRTVLDELWDSFPQMTENEIRSTLAAVLFTADDIHKKVSSISGGESARLQLARLSLEHHNTLLFDEPTNHLDMMSREKLEAALSEFGGTELIISHDRYLLNKIPDKIIYISKDRVTVFNGKFDELTASPEYAQSEDKPKPTEKKHRTAAFNPKGERAAKARKRNRLSECEKKINQLEERISQLEQLISDTKSDYEVLTAACSELEEKKSKLDSLTDLWLELCE